MTPCEREIREVVRKQIESTKAFAEECAAEIGLIAERYGIGEPEITRLFVRATGEVARQVMPELMHEEPPAPPSARRGWRWTRLRPRSHHHEE